MQTPYRKSVECKMKAYLKTMTPQRQEDFFSKHLDFTTLPSFLRSDSAPQGITQLFCSRADSVISLVAVSSPALTQ